MKSHLYLKLLAAFTLALVVIPLFRWTRREIGFHDTLKKYSQEFIPGMRRKAVEERLQVLRPDFTRYSDRGRDEIELADLGGVFCRTSEVIFLEFEMRDPQKIDENDVLRKVGLREREDGCM